ncbi:homoserine dehydrogenase [Clostridium tyrobutyricum]|uniref:homoserine dehydrogenase n=1 Tax=Clostridium tyrobutyricum TaxID=1519 RepID=UPI0020110CFE|nr:homoserine dehydrogenase [Clostridium tyrobutyricum]MBR9649198.1 homoserine dehydrogenase [Clostridium tyrobutyricum]
MKKVRIALLGLGNVGIGVCIILYSNRKEIMKRSGYEVEIAKILVRDKNKDRDVYIPDGVLTTDFNDILNDDSIKVVVEVMGGIQTSKDYILKCMDKKKHIVTANKMLLATNGDELFQKAESNGVMLQYEASVAGGIPIINGIEESLTANKIKELYGIVNGTTNYILTKMQLDKMDFDTALKQAQEKGYAEADPTSDIEGFDAQYKLAILSSLAFGTKINIDNVYREGITKISSIDIKYAKKFNMVVKMLAIAKDHFGRLELRVHPTMIPNDHPLANVYDSFNAIFIKGNAVGDLMFYGRGAGSLPTGSAVVSDIIAILRKNVDSQSSLPALKNNLWDRKIDDIGKSKGKFYIRITVEDQSGALGKITTIFGKYSISIRSVIQKGEKNSKGGVNIVLITHNTCKEKIDCAVKEINNLESVIAINNIIRIEDFK